MSLAQKRNGPLAWLRRLWCMARGHKRPLAITDPSWGEGAGWCGRCGRIVLGPEDNA